MGGSVVVSAGRVGMVSDLLGEPSWVERVCLIAASYRTDNRSIRELFELAAPDFGESRFVELVARRLALEPGLVEAWQQYSADKRGAPSPFLQGTKVGFVEKTGGKVAAGVVGRFDSEAAACAVFIMHEAAWVLEGRRVTWSTDTGQ